MKGICDGRQLSLGTVLLPMIFAHLQIEHKIHVVDDKFPIPAHGIIGKDFIKRNKCLIDYDQMTLTLRPSNVLPATIPIRAEVLRGLSVLPARSETFKMFRVSSTKYPCIIESQEIAENVFIPTTVIHAQQCWIRVLNVNDSMKFINTQRLKASNLSEFSIFTYKNSSDKPLTRAL